MNYARKNLIYLKQVYTFQSNQIKFEYVKSETKSQIKADLLYLANSYCYNDKPSPRILHQHRVLRNLRMNKE